VACIRESCANAETEEEESGVKKYGRQDTVEAQ